MYPQANAAPRYTKSAHQPKYNQKEIHHTSVMVPLSHHHLLLPQEEVVAHHHLPQAVVDHPQDPPAPTVGIHSSLQQALLLAALWPAMVAAPPHTAPGSSRPGYASTCPQAHPATPSPDDEVCHQSPLRPPPEERVMAPHQGHRTDASSLPSRALLVTPWHHPADVSLHATVSPALDEPTCSLHLHLAPTRCHICTCKKQQQKIVSTSISYTYGLLSHKTI
jgi:hypothetical protein